MNNLKNDLELWLSFLEVFSELYPETYNTPEKALEGFNQTMEHYNNILILLRNGKDT